MNNNRHWLCRVSSRWDQEMDKEALKRLKVHPDLEAFRVFLAQVALPLVEAQARVQFDKPEEAPRLAVENASKLDLIRRLFLMLDD